MKAAKLNDWSNFKRAVWFWHFWVGVLISPILIVAALTGAIYVFKPELEMWWYADIAAGNSTDGSIPSLAESIVAAEQAAGADWRATGLEIESFTGRRPAVLLGRNNKVQGFKRIYVDTQRVIALGEIPTPNFFSVVLDLHRRLMIGTTGRILIELTTGWTIVMAIMGIALWWPRSLNTLRGLFIVRWNVKAYVVVRDLHAILGSIASLIIILIALSGLSYSYVWGFAYHASAFATGQYAMLDFEAPKKQDKADVQNVSSSPQISVDEALAIAIKEGIPISRISIGFPDQRDEYYSIEAGGTFGSSIQRIIRIDRNTGEILQQFSIGDLPPMAWWTQWNYPLHVGSFGGIISKSIWVAASMVMVFLPLSGYFMYFARRKSGSLSLPRHVSFPRSNWMVAAVSFLCVSLPVVGLSVLLANAFLWLKSRRRN